MRTLTASCLFDPRSAADGWEIVQITAGYERDILVLSREHPWRERGSYGPPIPSRYRVNRWLEGEVTSVLLPETVDRIGHVQLLAKDHWLLVRSRTRKSEQDRNAQVYDSNGVLVGSLHAGDGIEDVQTTEAGQIWVSYFDEGVFGDLPLGSSGLVCFGLNGEAVFQFPGDARPAGLRSIASCYALNVATNEETWFCYYTDFPLVLVRNKAVADYWPNNPVEWSHAFAVADERVLFAGFYRERGRIAMLHLTDMAVEEVTLADASGDRLFARPGHRGHFARAGQLYIDAEDGVFVVSLDDVQQT